MVCPVVVGWEASIIPALAEETGCSAAAQTVMLENLLALLLGRIASVRQATGRETMRQIRVAQPEIMTIDRRGFWLSWRDEELYVPFALFPWFEHATVAQLCRVEQLGRDCLYWPGLDLELALDRIRHPMAAAAFAVDR
jgi:hypothetical protein